MRAICVQKKQKPSPVALCEFEEKKGGFKNLTKLFLSFT